MNVQETLTKLVSFNSIFGNEKAIAEWLESLLKDMGFEVTKVPIAERRWNVIGTRGTGTPHLLLYGHMDTVPDYKGWETDPFTLTQKNDQLFGLGACDMKGGIAALLCALRDIPQELPIKVMFAPDEENDSAGAWHMTKEGRALLSGITHMISVEPGASATKIGGADVLTLGRRGRVRFIVKFTGISAHGGHVDRGINAIDLATKFVQSLDTVEIATHPNLGPGSHYAAAIRAESKGLSLPDYCEVEIERHIVMPETPQSCVEQYTALAQKILATYQQTIAGRTPQVEVMLKPREFPYMEPFETPADDPLAQLAADVIQAHSNALTRNYGRSVGDENVFATQLGIKPLIIGPEGGNVHSPNEWVSLASLKTCVDIYKDILTQYAGKV